MHSGFGNNFRVRVGFTLVELMISIAIVLVLMLGINFVFSTSSRTISGGMALSAASRDMRGARKVMEADFANAVSSNEMPALIIHSETRFAFRDRNDMLADYDYDPMAAVSAQIATYDIDGQQGNGDEIDLMAPALENLYNDRRHRLDRISFFTANNDSLYRRQTGDDTTFVAAQTSPEAWVTYGPLRLAGNPSPANGEIVYWRPGGGIATNNPNNFFAVQFALGRRVILLKPDLPAGDAQLGGINFGAAALNSTRQQTTTGGPYPTATAWQTQESRLDITNTSVSALRLAVASLPETWWANFDVLDSRTYQSAAPADISLNYYFWAKPFINKSGFTEFSAQNLSFDERMANQTREAALAAPIFLRGCSQFMVEFAGDFYDQGPASGYPVEPVGMIDFIPDATAPEERRIRWYGLPRDTDNNATTLEVDLLSNPPLMATGAGAAAPRWGAGAGREMITPAGGGGEKAAVWAWGPNEPGVAANANNYRPRLIRITMQLLDANGRLSEGPRIEYVFRMK